MASITQHLQFDKRYIGTLLKAKIYHIIKSYCANKNSGQSLEVEAGAHTIGR